jgi:hypothetical protein
MDSKKLAAPPSSNQQGTLRISDTNDRNVKERSSNVGDLVLPRIQNTEGLHKLSSP